MKKLFIGILVTILVLSSIGCDELPDLEVVKIQAEASLYAGQREAEMNQRIAEALTPDLIQYYEIKQWDGKLPTFMGGESTMPILNFGAVE